MVFMNVYVHKYAYVSMPLFVAQMVSLMIMNVSSELDLAKLKLTSTLVT